MNYAANTTNAANDTKNSLSKILALGCPRTADVRAAKHILYLASKGIAGGFQNEATTKKHQVVVARHNTFQDAQRAMSQFNAVLNSRPRYKKQQRPA